MGKTGKWLKGFLTGGKKKNKDKEKDAAEAAATATATPGSSTKEKERGLRPDHYHAMMYESKSGPLPSTAVPREKRRWSFRRSSGAARELNFPSASAGGLPRNRLAELEPEHWKHHDRLAPPLPTTAAPAATTSVSSSSGILLPRNRSVPESQGQVQQQRTQHHHRHDMAMASATTAAAEAAAAAAQAAAVVVRMSAAAAGRRARNGRSAVEESAAIKIQAVFRGHLARKALKALRGLVKLQALIRGHIVRKQATAALRCMHTLVSVQERARAQRIYHAEEVNVNGGAQRQAHRRSSSPQNRRIRHTYEMDRSPEENIKIVEMDLGIKGGWSRNGHPVRYSQITGHRFSSLDAGHASSNVDIHYDIWSAASGLTDLSPRTSSGRYEDISYKAIQSSPEYMSAMSKMEFLEAHMGGMTSTADTYAAQNEFAFCPSYMANTESSKAKARSQSAPKQRPDNYERQTVKRRSSPDSKSTPRGVRMQRSSSQVGPAQNGHQYPWSIKLDQSNTSLKDSECGSSSTVTNTDYRPLVMQGVRGGGRY